MDDIERLAERLYFHSLMDCKHCGACCRPRMLGVEKEDIQRIADHFRISFEKAKRKYTSPHPIEIGRRIINSPPHRCRFFNPISKRCRIYKARPYNCRTFPFFAPALRRAGKMFVRDCPAAQEMTNWNAFPTWPPDIQKEIDAYYTPRASAEDKMEIILKLITLVEMLYNDGRIVSPPGKWY